MRRRHLLVFVGLSFAVLAAIALRPQWMKMRTRSALEEAASNACACMLGDHGDVATNLLRVRAGLITKPPAADREWPRRCKPWGEAALSAYDDAARWNPGLPHLGAQPTWSSVTVLEALHPFWVREPDPRVPLPDVASFAASEDALVPIVTEEEPELRVAEGKLTVGRAIAIDGDDRVEQRATTATSFPRHPEWSAVDGEPGAKRFWSDRARFYDDTGHAVGGDADSFMSLVWARSFADGRLVAHVYKPSLAEDAGEIWELSPDGKLRKAPFEMRTPDHTRSTTFVGSWILYKHLGEQGGEVAAIDLRRGVQAKPVVLGPIEKTSRALGRSYGACVARTTFVDMDPGFAIGTGDGWRYADLQQSVHRVVSCAGDVAVVTEWVPLEIRKCTPTNGCELVPFPGLSAGPADQFAADEHYLFQIVRDDGAVGIHIHSLANPTDVRHVALLDHAHDVRLRVVAGRALVFARKKLEAWAVFSVRPDGAVRTVR